MSQKKYNGGAISDSDRQIMNKFLDDKMTALNKYIKKLELEKNQRPRKETERWKCYVF